MKVEVVKILIRVLVLERFHASKPVMVRRFLEAWTIQISGRRAKSAAARTPVALSRTAPSIFI